MWGPAKPHITRSISQHFDTLYGHQTTVCINGRLVLPYNTAISYNEPSH